MQWYHSHNLNDGLCETLPRFMGLAIIHDSYQNLEHYHSAMGASLCVMMSRVIGLMGTDCLWLGVFLFFYIDCARSAIDKLMITLRMILIL
ncbi:hypothetical protein BSQ33_08290 [Vibrio gazogenes]|uniref:Uncharacterized protein n=1 Tax=Vibrio gazogenes TaxID=687 RepID=A0A1Z2SEV7_VIBGA|nr:hypothetical protein BSQ33_08290 [Vibrio gazogenes]